MKVLIIEDEHHAQRRLKNLVKTMRSQAKIMGIIDSIEETVEWLNQNHPPDLIFLDIQLSDGLSFEIFTQVQLEVPVIFTTAFDEYAIKAFKINSVDYLLKPIEEEDLERALQKFERHFNQKTNYDFNRIQGIVKALTQQKYPERFLIKSGQQLTYVSSTSISYLFSENSLSFIQTQNGKKHIIDYTLDQLSDMLDPKHFFRINRKMIIHIDAIQKISPYFNNRLLIELKPKSSLDALVSREKVKAFKTWLGV